MGDSLPFIHYLCFLIRDLQIVNLEMLYPMSGMIRFETFSDSYIMGKYLRSIGHNGYLFHPIRHVIIPSGSLDSPFIVEIYTFGTSKYG